MKDKNKSPKSSMTLEVMKFFAVASAVLGVLAILYFGSLSILSLVAGPQRYSVQGHRYGYPINASTNSTFNQSAQNGTTQYLSGSAVRSGFLLNVRSYVYGLFSGVLMVLLGIVTLKYAKLRMKVAAD